MLLMNPNQASQPKGTDPVTTKCNKIYRSVKENRGSSPLLTPSKDIEDSFAAAAAALSLVRNPQVEGHILAGLAEERRMKAGAKHHCQTDSEG